MINKLIYHFYHKGLFKYQKFFFDYQRALGFIVIQ